MDDDYKTRESDRAKLFVDRLLHRAHLAYQREQLRPSADASPKNNPHAGACPEVRGVRRQQSIGERKAQVWQPHWQTGLRPNFWKAYFDTLLYMGKK